MLISYTDFDLLSVLKELERKKESSTTVGDSDETENIISFSADIATFEE